MYSVKDSAFTEVCHPASEILLPSTSPPDPPATPISFNSEPFPPDTLPDSVPSPTPAPVPPSTTNSVSETSCTPDHCSRFIPSPLSRDFILESNSLASATDIDRNRMLPLSRALLKTTLYFDGHPVRVLIDGGFQENFISTNLVQSIHLQTIPLAPESQFALSVASGATISHCSTFCLGLLSDGDTYEEKMELYVAPIRYDIVLGKP